MKKGVFMQRSTLPTGVKTLMNWKEKKTLTFDNPVQRAGSQWNLLQKSLLIHSMLANYPIPGVYLLKGKNAENVTVYDCLDAKQRLTSVFEFINGEYELHSATPEVLVDGTTYDLANIKFEDMSDECKDAITGYRFSINCIEEATEEEIEEIFKRLNNSTPLSAIQKARTVMGSNLARWTKELCNMHFFQHSINLTVAQLRREADLETLLQGMLLISSREGSYTDWKAISTAEVTKYCEYIRNNYGDDKILEIMSVVDYLSKAFVDKHKFLKKSNIPTVLLLGKVAVENELDPHEFKSFIDVFSNCICTEYDENCGSGNVKRVKTEGRLLAIAKKFKEYFELDDIGILYADEVAVKAGSFDETPSSTEEEKSSNDVVEEDEIPSVNNNTGVGSEEDTSSSDSEVALEEADILDNEENSSDMGVESEDTLIDVNNSDELASDEVDAGVENSMEDDINNSDEHTSAEDDTEVFISNGGVAEEVVENDQFMNEPVSVDDDNTDNSEIILEREAV